LAVTFGWAQTTPADQQKAMDAYMKAAAVTANHQALKYFVGKWDVESTMWTVPGAPPSTSKNVNDGVLIMGGRYVRMDYRGQMMGMPFEGLQITGYDNIEKAYKTLWIDNSSTSFYVLTGQYDAAKKTYTNIGSWADPVGGTTPVRMVIRIVSQDEYVSETYMKMPDGKDFKSMVDRYIRRKASTIKG
jgi:hypothetical protein